MIFNPEKIKKDFPLLNQNPDLVYLDTAASSQTPRQVIDSMDNHYKSARANIHRGIHDLSQKATEEYENARIEVARFLDASPEEIIFTSGATASSNMLAIMLEKSIDFQKNDEVIVSTMDHHSALLPMQGLAKNKKLLLKYVEVTPDFELDYENLKSLITKNTKIISIPLVSNVLGTINDIKKIREFAKDAILIVDATEAIGHIPVSVKKLECDFMYFSGHKMCGPTGTGVLYGKKELLEKMEPAFLGGGAVSEVDRNSFVLKNTPEKFESGTPNISGVAGLGEAVKYLDNIGLNNILKHSQELVSYATEKLSSIDGLRIIAPKDLEKNSGIISFTIEGIHPHDIAQVLSDNNVAIRAGHHCAMPLMKFLGLPSTARASFYLYNTKEDVNLLANALYKTIELFNVKQ